MKKALIAVAFVIALVVWFGLWFRDKEAVATSAARPWPGEMGPLQATADQWPQLKANAASVKLTELGKELPKNNAVDDFVEREIARGELTIGDPPALTDASPISEILLREPIIWESRIKFDDVDVAERRTIQMTMARALVASALTKARANDPAAWDNLHAVWKLARTLDAHPQMMAQTAALSMARMINAVAWKMPLPAPPWFSELQARDNVRPLVAAFQYQAAYYWESGARIFPTKWLAASIDHDRKIAEEVSNLSGCDVNTTMNDPGTDLTSVWRRAFRYRAEREATANALRVREGKPIETASRCSDGTWTFDGTTLHFSREIAPAATDTSMPLTLRVKP